MSLRGTKGVGIPTVLLHEGEGLAVTIETKSGHVYRGVMDTVEDTMNTGMRDVTVTDPDGNKTSMQKVFLRGSQIVLVIFPDVLKKAPMFERLRKASLGLSLAAGLGRGRQQAIEANAARRAFGEQGGRGRGRGGPPGGGMGRGFVPGAGMGGGGGGGFGPRPMMGGGGFVPPPGPGAMMGGGVPGGMMGPPRGFPFPGPGGPPPGPGAGRGVAMTAPAWMNR